MKKLFLKTLMTTLVLLTGGVSSAWADEDVTLTQTGHITIVGTGNYEAFDVSKMYVNSYAKLGGAFAVELTLDEKFNPSKVTKATLKLHINGKPNKNRTSTVSFRGHTSDPTPTSNVNETKSSTDGKAKIVSYGGDNTKRWVWSNTAITTDSWSSLTNSYPKDNTTIDIDVTSFFKSLNGLSSGDVVWITADVNDVAADISVDGYGSSNPAQVVITYSESEQVDYSINYQLDGTTVATETNSSTVGTTVNAQSSIWNDDNTQKYFVTDEAITSFEIEEGTNTFNVPVREAEIWTFSVYGVIDGDPVLELSTYSVVEGETVQYGYPQYVGVNEMLYKSNQQSTNPWWGGSYTPTADGESVEITYTDQNENAYLCIEAEDIDGMSVAEGGNIDIRASNRKGGYGENVLIQIVDPGRYKIKSAAYGNKGTTFTFKAGETTVLELTTDGNPVLTESDEFTLYEETEITVSGGNAGSSPKVLDYVIIQRLGDLEDEALATAKEELQIAIAYAESIGAEELADAIGTAQAAYDAEDATAESVSQATAALVLAVKQYAKGALQTVLDLAEEMLNNSGELDEEIQEFKTELDGAIEAANAALDDDEKTPEEIMTALDELSNAALVFASETLAVAIKAAKAIDTEGKNGAEELADAIQAAEAAFAEESIQGFYQAGLALKQAIDDFNAANEPTFAITDYLINADFSSTEGWTAYASGANGTNYQDYNNGLIGTYQVRFSPATVDDTHLATEYCFGFECRWQTNYSSFNQETIEELSAGEYTLTFDVENVNGSTTKAAYNNLFYVKVGETTYADNSTEWMDGKSSWTTHTIEFTLAEPAKATVSFGYGTGSNNFGANNTPALYVSHLALSYKSLEEIAAEELAAAKDELQKEIKKAAALKTAGRTVGLDDYKTAIVNAVSVYNNGTTAEEVNAAIAPLKAAETAFLVANKPIEDGTYYVYNPLTKKFLARGNAWGTSAVVADYGVAIKVTSSDANYSLVGFDNNAFYGFDEWMYADAGGNNVRTYILDKVENGITMTNTNNNMLVYVYLKEDGNKYRVAGNAIKDNNYTDDAQTVWQFITPDAYNDMIANRIETEITAAFTAAEIAEDAEVEIAEPVELTFASGHGWTQTVVREQKDQPATNGNGTEMWQATGYYTQTVSDLPSGLYKVSIQAFYRNGGADECVTRYNTGYNTVLAYLDANGCIAQVKSWAEDKGEGNDPNDMGQAKAKFDDGKYVSETYAYVGDDGILNLTVYNPAHIGNGWFIVGNVKYAAVTLPAEPDVVITAIDAPELLASGFSSEVTVTVSSAIDIENAVVTLLLGDTEAGTSDPVSIVAGEEAIIPMMVDVAYGVVDDYMLSATLIYDDLEGDPIGCADEVKQTVRVTYAGDPNGDFEVTVSDAALTVMFALGTQEPTETQFRLADMNESGDITVSDAVAVVNKASGLIFARESERSTTQGANYLTQDGTEIGLVNTTDFVGFQMDVTLSDGAVLNGVRLTERASGLQLFTSRIDQNTWRIIALSLDGTVISGNEGTLLSLDITGNGQASFSRIEFTDTAAQAHQLGFGSPTGINVLYNNKVDGEVYTLGGTRTGNLKKGVNVVRQADGQVRKVLVK